MQNIKKKKNQKSEEVMRRSWKMWKIVIITLMSYLLWNKSHISFILQVSRAVSIQLPM